MNSIDVLSLEGFATTLEARLDEAEAIRISLVELLRRTAPQLGDLPDALYVGGRYQALYDQHLDRLNVLINALLATRDALTTIISNYVTLEERLTANANEIADALGGISGVPNGAHTHAG